MLFANKCFIVIATVCEKMKPKSESMNRKNRYKSRQEKLANYRGYFKRKTTSEKVCHYILFPVVSSTVGRPSDFFFHALSLCWNDKNVHKDAQCIRMFRGMRLKQEINISDLCKNNETGWFTGSNAGDLEKIGKVAGYFVRVCAVTVCSALDESFNIDDCKPVLSKYFNDCVKGLKESKTVIPVVVKLEISPHSYFDFSKFICLNEDLVRNVTNGKKVVGSRRATLLEIDSQFHDWAWTLLNTEAVKDRLDIVNAAILPPAATTTNYCEQLTNAPNTHYQNNYRTSDRTKLPNTKYPETVYHLH